MRVPCAPALVKGGVKRKPKKMHVRLKRSSPDARAFPVANGTPMRGWEHSDRDPTMVGGPKPKGDAGSRRVEIAKDEARAQQAAVDLASGRGVLAPEEDSENDHEERDAGEPWEGVQPFQSRGNRLPSLVWAKRKLVCYV